MDFNKLVTVTFTLFAVIDIIGSIPVLISLKNKSGDINAAKVTLVSGMLMILFLYAGKPLLKVLNLDVHSFAVGGSIVMFLVGLEMVLGLDIFKEEPGFNRNACAYCISFNCWNRHANHHHVFKSEL